MPSWGEKHQLGLWSWHPWTLLLGEVCGILTLKVVITRRTPTNIEGELALAPANLFCCISHGGQTSIILVQDSVMLLLGDIVPQLVFEVSCKSMHGVLE